MNKLELKPNELVNIQLYTLTELAKDKLNPNRENLLKLIKSIKLVLKQARDSVIYGISDENRVEVEKGIYIIYTRNRISNYVYVLDIFNLDFSKVDHYWIGVSARIGYNIRDMYKYRPDFQNFIDRD